MQPGTRLGPYEILSPLGAGGMREVYRAKDTRLERDVAIKVLPETGAIDALPTRAQLLAALNPPAHRLHHPVSAYPAHGPGLRFSARCISRRFPALAPSLAFLSTRRFQQCQCPPVSPLSVS
jgi:serine/threonine protein kinase